MKVNIITDTDGYKQGHWSMINPGLSLQYVYGEARVGAKYDRTLVFGMQAIIDKYFKTPITKEDVAIASAYSTQINGYDTVNVDVWNRIVEECDGYLPIEIKCAPEGTIVPSGEVLFTMRSTKDWFAKDMSLLEPLLMHIWYPTTIATRTLYLYESLAPIFKKTGDIDILPYMVNDFGFRGATTRESAIMAGMAHLLLFKGSDNIPAIRGLHEYYNVPLRDIHKFASTVKASEHSVALSYGSKDEKQYLKNVINSLPEDALGSNVIDTYDAIGYIMNVASDPEIVDLIKKRKAKLVFRPDSGDFMEIIPKLLDMLSSIFGSTVNEHGYRVLNHVSLIQGDGMDTTTMVEIYAKIVSLGYACSNLAVGSGGGIHQKDVTRDTQRFAIKPSFGIINGEPYNFMKRPLTDLTKASKPGMLKLNPAGKTYMTISSANTTASAYEGYVDAMVDVFVDGEVKNVQTFQMIKDRVQQHLKN